MKPRMMGLFVVFTILGAACRLGVSASPPVSTMSSVSTITAPASGISFDRSRLSTVERDVTYCTMDGEVLKMDIYYPAAMDSAWPVVVYVHGGAWVKGDKSEGAGIGDQPELTAANFMYVSIDYRLAPGYMFPAMIEDVKCAVRYLRAHADLYNLDPQRMGALGGSAGGHLVSLLGVSDQTAGWDVGEYLDQSSRVQAVVDYFGPADLTDPSFDTEREDNRAAEVFGTTDQSDPLLAAASPVSYTTPDDPPFLIVQGDQDTAVPPAQSQILYDHLQAVGVPATLVMVENAGHGFNPISGKIDPTRREITQRVVSFFSDTLR